MPEITVANWITIFGFIFTGVLSFLGVLVGMYKTKMTLAAEQATQEANLENWKDQRVATDKAQSEQIAELHNIVKELASIQSDHQAELSKHAAEITTLKEDSKTKDQALREISQALKNLDSITTELRNMKETFASALLNFEKLYNEKIGNLKEAVEKAPATKRVYSKRTSTKATK